MPTNDRTTGALGTPASQLGRVVLGAPYPTFVGPKDLTGAANGNSTASATISAKRSLVGSSAGLATDTAQLSVKRLLTPASVVAGVAVTTGAINRGVSLVVSSAVGTATTTAYIQRYRNLLASSNGVATVSTALLLLKRALTGTSNGQATVSSPQMLRIRALVGSSNGRATVQGRPITIGFVLWTGSTFTLVGNYPVVLWDKQEFELQPDEGETVDYVAWKDSTDQFHPVHQ